MRARVGTSQDAEAISDTAPDSRLGVGSVFGRYRIVRLLGEGRMGAVYEAVHLDLHKRVAIKTLRPELAKSGQAAERFVREGQAAARLRHPHVVDVTDVGEHRGVAFLVMEYLEGENLGSFLTREGPLSEARTASLLIPVCAAVEAAHGVGIVHRDIKPDNIFLARDGFGELQPKVVDFGISKLTGGPNDFALTGSGALLGTVPFMSPEQAAGAKHVDARSDQFSLGVILYECVTGKRPFAGDALLAILVAITEGRCEAPRALRPDLSLGFEALIQRAMRTSRDDRFPSVAAMGKELLAFADASTRASWAPRFGGTQVLQAADPPSKQVIVDPPQKPNTLSDPAQEITLRREARGARQLGVVAENLAGVAAVVVGAWSLWPHRDVRVAHGGVPSLSPVVTPVVVPTVLSVAVAVVPLPTVEVPTTPTPSIAVVPTTPQIEVHTRHHGHHRASEGTRTAQGVGLSRTEQRRMGLLGRGPLTVRACSQRGGEVVRLGGGVRAVSRVIPWRNSALCTRPADEQPVSALRERAGRGGRAYTVTVDGVSLGFPSGGHGYVMFAGCSAIGAPR